MKIYVTFGQIHRHKINGKVYDKDCVAVIEAKSYSEGRRIAESMFGRKFCFTYDEHDWKECSMAFYPRGYIYVEDKT